MDTARTRRDPARSVVAVLILAALIVAVTLLGAPRAGAARALQVAAPSTPQAVVLAQDDGLTLVGAFSALNGKPAPALDDLSHTDAARLAQLPRLNVFFRGAVCRWHGRFRSPLLLTIQLPKAIFARTSLPLYRLQSGRWVQLRKRAVVGDLNSTATATIVRPGRYAVCLTRAWKVLEEDGYRLVTYSRPYQTTTVLSPELVARGSTTDPSVVRAVMDVAGQTETQARSTLVSYDSATTPVSVFRLTSTAAVLRNWSGTSTVGRWFAPSTGGELPSPESACAVYALPAGNLAIDVTLHLVTPGTALISGVCADMTSQQGYGPWATGGGEQLFGPLVSTYPPPAYDAGRISIISELRWEQSEPEAIDW
jgi:hypothetical protein